MREKAVLGHFSNWRKLVLVIPAQAGIQALRVMPIPLDPGFRRDDDACGMTEERPNQF
ncbi:MAG: hypothetical protein FWG73_08485 [Planctomycetaceae bacterium]|nr:hypothetical protein [Planctomycetaceae bacterium]